MNEYGLYHFPWLLQINSQIEYIASIAYIIDFGLVLDVVLSFN